jgi:iron-sulfur cluster assembly accessory protein
MNLTTAAVKKVDQLIKAEGPGLFLRLAVSPGGCSGLRYQIYFDNMPRFDDVVMPYKKFDLRIDKMSDPYLIDATMDYVDQIDKQGFTIDNPAAQGTCACGDSFN